MKKIVNILLLIAFVSVVGFIVYKETNRKNHVPDFLLGKAQYDSIKVERRIKGKILPAEEIKVKSKINGIVEAVFVEVGQKVEAGQKIAIVRNLSEPMDIENLKLSVALYEIQLQTSELNFEREKKLSTAGLSTMAEFENIEADFQQATEQLESARKKLQMATTGVITSDKELSNTIYAPASGTILTLISKPGSPVIKQNNYNEGTTLATIADMNSLMFFGKILERDLNKLYEGQSLRIETLLTKESIITGHIEKIYPKGVDENGIVKFPIEASITKSNIQLWGGINATAIITIEKKDSVICLEEKYLKYENDSCYAYIKSTDNNYIKKSVLTGISDGIKTEIIEGIEQNIKVKLPE